MKHNIGLFGGSFNPIHIGHCIMAERFIDQCNLDVCYLIPTFQSPLKTTSSSISAEHRLGMCRIISRTNPMLRVWDGEVRRKGVSYTIDTLHTFCNKYPQSNLFLLIGQDQAIQFSSWKSYQEILQKAQLCVVQRGNEDLNLPEFLYGSDSKKALVIQSPRIDVSSSGIRADILSGKSIRYYVHDKVLRYIKQHNLYRRPK